MTRAYESPDGRNVTIPAPVLQWLRGGRRAEILEPASPRVMWGGCRGRHNRRASSTRIPIGGVGQPSLGVLHAPTGGHCRVHVAEVRDDVDADDRGDAA